MKVTLQIIVLLFITGLVSSAVFVGFQFLVDDKSDNDSKLDSLQNKIKYLENLIESQNQDSLNKNDELQKFLAEAESNLKLKYNYSDEPDLNELESRLNTLEEMNKAENTDNIARTDNGDLAKAIQDEIDKYIENLKKEQLDEKKKREFDKIFGKFKEDLIKLCASLGISDNDVEKMLSVGADYINTLLELKEEYGIDENSELSVEQKQEYFAKMKELEREEFYKKLRDSVGDSTFMTVRTASRRRKDLKDFEKTARKLNLEDWQKKEINEALNRHYEQTKYVDMIIHSEKHSDSNVKDYKEQIENSWKIFVSEVTNNVLTDEQRKLASGK